MSSAAPFPHLCSQVHRAAYKMAESTGAEGSGVEASMGSPRPAAWPARRDPSVIHEELLEVPCCGDRDGGASQTYLRQVRA